jgi:hypothetical protein
MFVSVTHGIFVLCHHFVVNLFVRKPELNGANLPNFDLNSCHFCPSFFCPPTVPIKSKITKFVSVKFGFLRKGYKNYDGVNDVYLSSKPSS